MSATEAAPGSPDPTALDLSLECERLNAEFWQATVYHLTCDHDALLITLFGGLLAIARTGDTIALQTVRDAVAKVGGHAG